MKHVYLALLALALIGSVNGGAYAAEPTGPRRPVVAPDSATTEKFDVNGLTVILRRNSANEVVVANLYLLGGARQLTSQTAGIEALILAASERGTKRFPGAALRQRTARLGSTIGIEANDDWSAIGMRAIRSTFDSTWAIFADRVMAPTLDPTEVEIVRDQLLTVAREQSTQPDDAATQLADSLLYINHPNALSPTGTPESIASLTAAQLKQYHTQQFVTSRMLLVVVGNVDRAQLERLVRTSLSTMPRGTYKWSAPPPVVSTGRALAIDNRPLPTNYLLGYAPGPSATDPDYTALRVATAVLSGRLFTEVRSRRNLSYAVEAPFLERANAVGGLYVTTVDPNQVLRLMRQELTTLQTESVDPVGLKRLEQQFITEYYLKNETNADQANVLARAELYQGDFRAADRFMEGLRRVTPEDVRRVARQYLKDFRFAYVGDASKLDKSLLTNF
ncbi:MAG: peptidase domain protein [Gemmatimonadetes bacterium]|nr:peptidase domain protein [Gemmatimonadota bacterium]